MNREQLYQQVVSKKSFLCVGLDPDPERIPEHLKEEEDPIFAFNKAIIDATADYAVAYKPNLAFYEAAGTAGWEAFRKTIDYIPDEIFTIADAKRGDIGNTSRMYARAFFDELQCDSLTVAPYMGEDSVKPYLEFPGKWAVVLGATSNKGAEDFQQLRLADTGKELYRQVISTVASWGNPDNIMFVVGATRPQILAEIRQMMPEHFFLIPGVGAQGGSLAEVCHAGMNKQCGILVNSSRGIIFADSSKNFADAAAQKAKILQQEMQAFL